MSQYLVPSKARLGRTDLAVNKEKQTKEDLFKELTIARKKLEELIIRQYEKGDCNLGTSLPILKQSGIMDRLLVDLMMLEDANDIW